MGRLYVKFCSEHKKLATYCSIEKRWICPECPMNEEFEKTNFLQSTRIHGRKK